MMIFYHSCVYIFCYLVPSYYPINSLLWIFESRLLCCNTRTPVNLIWNGMKNSTLAQLLKGELRKLRMLELLFPLRSTTMFLVLLLITNVSSLFMCYLTINKYIGMMLNQVQVLILIVTWPLSRWNCCGERLSSGSVCSWFRKGRTACWFNSKTRVH